ncbi:MAG: hypothetical protein RL398_1671 [Planctomycetota bacterium]|jgi:hypothetical protein
MGDALYWATRVGLVLGWLALAAHLWRSQRRGAACLVLWFASVRAWPWNYLLLDAARAGLRALSVYDNRIVAKWSLLAVLAASALVALVVVWRRRGAANGLPVPAQLGLLAQFVLLAMETCSLDDWLPGWAVRQPGRYVLEGGALCLAWWGYRSRARSA